MPKVSLSLNDILHPVDPFYVLLEKFETEKHVEIPTVHLDNKDKGVLRRLLVDWDTGGPTEGLIIERYALPNEPGIDS